MLEHESSSTKSSEIEPLRQRKVADAVEHVRIEKKMQATNDKLGSTFFHHADEMLSGKNNCLLLSNVFLVRLLMVAYSNEVNKV